MNENTVKERADSSQWCDDVETLIGVTMPYRSLRRKLKATRKVTIFTIVVGFFSSVMSSMALSDAYFCVGEGSTGFKRNRNWEQTNFNVDNDKYIVRRVKQGEKDVVGNPLRSAYIINEVGKEFVSDVMNGCQFNQAGNLLLCEYFGLAVTVNLRELLFQSSTRFGYVLKDNEDFASDVSITIGKCSKIS